VTPAAQVSSIADRLPATVEQIVYLGSSVKYELSCAGMRVYARHTPRRRDATPELGESVAVEWDVADAVVVADA
jgi:ABC-type molybdate transport system ATPase subunit